MMFKAENIKYLVVAVFFIVAGCPVYGQDFKEAMESMRKVYGESDRFHIQMQVRVFESASSKQPHYTEDVVVWRNKDNYYYTFSNNRMIMNEKHFILVDEVAQTINIRPRDTDNEAYFDPPQILNMDSLLSFYEAPGYIGKVNNTDHYSLVQKEGIIGQIDLYLDRGSSLVNKIEYRYKSGQFVRIIFPVFDLKPEIKEEIFQDSQYFVASGDKAWPSEKYNGYELYFP